MDHTKDKTDQEKMRSDNAMICPQCNTIGKKSMLFSVPSRFVSNHPSTGICFQFWDEYGDYHYHYDCPTGLEFFRCSQNHLVQKHHPFREPVEEWASCITCTKARNDGKIPYKHDREGEDGWNTMKADEFYLEYVRDLTEEDERRIWHPKVRN